MQSLPNSHLNWQCGGLHCEKTDFHSLKNRFPLKKRQWSAQSLLTSSQWKRDKAELLKITPESNGTSISLWTQHIEMNFDYYIVKKTLPGVNQILHSTFQIHNNPRFSPTRFNAENEYDVWIEFIA